MSIRHSGHGIVPLLSTSPAVPSPPPMAQPSAKLDRDDFCACTACAESSVQGDPDTTGTEYKLIMIPSISPFKAGQKDHLIAIIAFWHCLCDKPFGCTYGHVLNSRHSCHFQLSSRINTSVLYSCHLLQLCLATEGP